MTSWRATQAKAQFSAVLDKAETEGPQLVERRKKRFFILTEEQLNARSGTQTDDQKLFVSAWDALRPSSGELFDAAFPRLRSKARVVKF